jgi:ABC-type microcin C transport system permease subunit YejB
VENGFSFFISEIHIDHTHITAQECIGNRAIAMRMTPCPFTRVLFAFCNGAVLCNLAVDLLFAVVDPRIKAMYKKGK